MKQRLIQFAKPVVSHSPQLAMTYRYARDTWKLYDKPRTTPMGFKMVGNSLMQHGEYEPDETALVKKILQYTDVFINIGANIGYYCCTALYFGKKTLEVVAFEPNYHNLLYLLQNIKANAWESRVEIFPIAVSNGVGVIEIYGGGPQASLVKGWGGRSDQYVVLAPCSTLDNILGSRFLGQQCFCLVDIEGAERMMLEGSLFFEDRNPKPIWMVEITVSENQPEGLRLNPHLRSTFQFFWDRGYEAWTADEQCRPVSPDEVERVAAGGPDTFSTHNFLFIERGKKSHFIDH